MDLRGFRGWAVEYTDGTVIFENQAEWRMVPKTGVKSLTLYFDGRRWDLMDKEAYLQRKRGSVVPGFSESFRVESRSIGYYEGNKKVWYTIDEVTGRMNVSVEEN